jgi:hypothetical protein
VSLQRAWAMAGNQKLQVQGRPPFLTAAHLPCFESPVTKIIPDVNANLSLACLVRSMRMMPDHVVALDKVSIPRPLLQIAILPQSTNETIIPDRLVAH